mmetsp:Transcript_39598/g.95106  ORF Transcript_39598/g.95106 Transcript_39598/m.95106 type:complete len:323 (-) Transcript_39598:662-1630(-)
MPGRPKRVELGSGPNIDPAPWPPCLRYLHPPAGNDARSADSASLGHGDCFSTWTSCEYPSRYPGTTPALSCDPPSELYTSPFRSSASTCVPSPAPRALGFISGGGGGHKLVERCWTSLAGITPHFSGPDKRTRESPNIGVSCSRSPWVNTGSDSPHDAIRLSSLPLDCRSEGTRRSPVRSTTSEIPWLATVSTSPSARLPSRARSKCGRTEELRTRNSGDERRTSGMGVGISGHWSPGTANAWFELSTWARRSWSMEGGVARAPGVGGSVAPSENLGKGSGSEYRGGISEIGTSCSCGGASSDCASVSPVCTDCVFCGGLVA